MNQGRSWFRVLALVLGFAFLYVPIVSLVVFSFNESRLVTVWGGFSTRWYGALLDNQQIIGAALLSRLGLAGHFAGRFIPPEALTDEYLWATPQFGVPAARRPGQHKTPPPVR